MLLFEGNSAGESSVKALQTLPTHRIPAGEILVHGLPQDTLLDPDRIKRDLSWTPVSEEGKQDEKEQASDEKRREVDQTLAGAPGPVITLNPDGTEHKGLPGTGTIDFQYSYGDFVIYWAGEEESRSWYVGQWLDQDDAGPGEIQLRCLLPYGNHPNPKGAWHYVWTASKRGSKAVLAPVGYGPTEKPHSKKSSSGTLTPEYMLVDETDLIMPIEFGEGQVIPATAWEELVKRVKVEDMARGYFASFAKKKRGGRR